MTGWSNTTGTDRCVICGDAFPEGVKRPRKFCGAECRAASRRRAHLGPHPPKDCECCGTPLDPYRNGQTKYCSHACLVRASSWVHGHGMTVEEGARLLQARKWCPWCGGEFKPPRLTQYFCGPKCGNSFHEAHRTFNLSYLSRPWEARLIPPCDRARPTREQPLHWDWANSAVPCDIYLRMDRRRWCMGCGGRLPNGMIRTAIYCCKACSQSLLRSGVMPNRRISELLARIPPEERPPQRDWARLGPDLGGLAERAARANGWMSQATREALDPAGMYWGD